MVPAREIWLRPLLLLAQDRQLPAQSEILDSQFGAVSYDASDQGKDDSYGAHFTGLPGC
ncbi:MAG: hypothetical protein IIB61_04560 [Planctomycetes bacterium]|nr:hypothetical protein [Planctomycetota bacterium]